MAKQNNSFDGDKKSEEVLADLAKDFGAGIVQLMDKSPDISVPKFSTGIMSLDIAMGGGVPRGRIIELYGPESSGKTTLSLHICAEVQKAGGRTAFLDLEQSFDPVYAKLLGVQPDKMIFASPEYGEQAFAIMEKLLPLKLDLIVVDSVSNMTPLSEIKGEYGDASMGSQARMMGQGLRKITSLLSKSHTTVIFLNQIRNAIGGYGSPERTSGGNALKFYASIRMDIRRKAKLEIGTGENKKVIGTSVNVRIIKNKVGLAFKEAPFDIMFKEGISVYGDVLETGVRAGVIQRAGPSYNFGDKKLGVGREAAKEFLKANPEVIKEIRELLDK
jgi:recombination protein RecA